MIKTLSTKESDEAVVGLVNKKLLRHTIQIFSKGDNGDLKPFGSGVLLQTFGEHFILTASHVADHLAKPENDLYVRVNWKLYIPISGDIKYTDISRSKGIDMAYIKIAPQMVPSLSIPYEFVTIDKIRNHNKKLDGMNYCVLGFPESNVDKDKKTTLGANYYLTSALGEKPYAYYKLDPKFFFIVDMKGQGTDMVTGSTTRVDSRFHGISGCGLWYILYNTDPHNSVISVDYRLIGIMTEFKKSKFFCLIANKIHHMIDAFRVIEKFSYNEIPVG